MNRILFNIHRVLAFLICLPLLLICVSGSALVFKHELDSILMPERVLVGEATATRLPFDTLLQSFNSHYPDYEVTGWRIFAKPNRSDLVYVMTHGGSDWSSLFVDPYTAKILSPPQPPRYYLSDALREFHYQLLLGKFGLFIAALLAVLMCLQAITGLILHRKFWKVLFTLRFQARPIIYLGDMHKLVGVLVSPVLLVLGVTGAYWNINQLIYSVAQPLAAPYIVDQRLYNSSLSVDALVAESRKRFPGFEVSFIALPAKPGYAINVLGGRDRQNPFFSEFSVSLSYHAQTGVLITARDIQDAELGDQITHSFRRLHFGDVAGLGSRMIWALVGFSPLALMLSGLSMYYLRRPVRKRIAERRREGRAQ
tara:strand:+ start:1584 stop:2687 length:1104 start_codon:yes stop_codon:yes gene_type:complete